MAMKLRYIGLSWTNEQEGPIVPWGGRRGDSGAPGVVESRPSFSFSIQVEIAESFDGAYFQSYCGEHHGLPMPTNDRSNCSKLQSFLLLLDARASSCLRLRRADLA